MSIDRRTLLKGGLGAGALVAVGAPPAIADRLPTARPGQGAQRRSSLFPGRRVVHADLHNHSHQSDGAGDPGQIHDKLRAAGIDVGALTDHTVAAFAFDRDVCAQVPDVVGERNECRSLFGMGDAGWQRTRELADAANATQRYAALPGFEWSSPHLGHMNIWFSEDWIDALQVGGITEDGLERVGLPLELLELQLRSAFGELLTDTEINEFLATVRAQEPTGMRRLYDWLLRRPGHGELGGGRDALAGFNHPNREPDVFDGFAYDERVADRMVTLEMFNRREDYLFKNLASGLPSPLVACLNAGWRVGIIGVTDEHGTDWGSEEGKGRAGVWLRGFNRNGVRRALLDRRVFATREAGLRLAATADGSPMGTTIEQRGRKRHDTVGFAVDLDLGPDHADTPVEIQVLRPGTDVPQVADVIDANPSNGPIRFSVPLDRDDGDWVVLRVADPATPNEAPAPFDHPCNNFGLAYSSPWWLEGAKSGRRNQDHDDVGDFWTPEDTHWWSHHHSH